MVALATATNPTSTPAPLDLSRKTIREPDVLRIVGVSSPTLRRMVRAGVVPPPFRTGPRGVKLWSYDGIMAWLASNCRPAVAGAAV